MDPRKLPPSRNTYLHPAPVRSYTPDVEQDYNPGISQIDLRRYGLMDAPAEVSLTAHDAVGDIPFHGVYVDQEGKVWLCDSGGNQPSLVPFPFERVRFEVGDEVFRELRYDPGVAGFGSPKIRCGKIIRADPDRLDPRRFSERGRELVRVEWEGEEGERLHSTTDIALYRGEQRFH